MEFPSLENAESSCRVRAARSPGPAAGGEDGDGGPGGTPTESGRTHHAWTHASERRASRAVGRPCFLSVTAHGNATLSAL